MVWRSSKCDLDQMNRRWGRITEKEELVQAHKHIQYKAEKIESQKHFILSIGRLIEESKKNHRVKIGLHQESVKIIS